MNINQILGIEPDNKLMRISIGITTAVIGAIFVMTAFLQNISSFGKKLIYTNPALLQTITNANNTLILLIFLYMVFFTSVLYYIFLPWKQEKEMNKF